jgi:hypothetical protein
VARYQRDGIVFPLRILDVQEAASYRAEFEAIGAALGGPLRTFGNLHLFFTWARELARQARLLDVVEDLLGPDLLIHSAAVFCKPERDPGFVSWHQDGTYSGLHATPTTTAWVALTHSTPENGCLRVIPGTHLQPMLPHVRTYAADNLLRRGEEVSVPIDESEAVEVMLQPGEASLHQNNLIHGSRPNSSAAARIGFIVRFVTPAFAQPGFPVVRARGQGDCRHLCLWDRPAPSLLEDSLAEHQAYLRLRAEPAVPGLIHPG